MSGGRLFLDVSRLLSRAGRESPTGIDRVELAYARHFLGRDGVRPVAVARGALRLVPQRGLGRYLDRLEQRWRGATKDATAGDRRLDRFLAGAAAEPYVEPPPPSVSRRLAGVLRGFGERPRPGPALARLDAAELAGGIYLNVSHHHLEKPWLLAAANGLGLEPVVYLHDVIPIDFPEYARPGDDAKHRRRMQSVADHARLVLVNSAHTAERVAAVAAALGRDDLPVAVAPLGLDLKSRAEAAAEAAGPYFLCVGTIEARKNHLMLLNLWRVLVERHGAAAPRLVVVGRRGWEAEQAIDMLERSRAIRGHVIEAGPIDDATLARLTAGARALLMPSFAEGFGLPVAEALAAGVPVIASDIPAHREVGGAVPDYLDPIDAADWGRAIVDYAGPASPRRAAQLQRLGGWRAPGWEAHFATVTELLGRPPAASTA